MYAYGHNSKIVYKQKVMKKSSGAFYKDFGLFSYVLFIDIFRHTCFLMFFFMFYL